LTRRANPAGADPVVVVVVVIRVVVRVARPSADGRATTDRRRHRATRLDATRPLRATTRATHRILARLARRSATTTRATTHERKRARTMASAALRVKRLSDDATMPTRGSEGAAGYDLARCESAIFPASRAGERPPASSDERRRERRRARARRVREI
jgi:hypothetical protein